jgi:para-nitrobenzyl esterase
MAGIDALFCVAETSSGEVQGLINGGVRQFKGVPYGAPTGGVGRFAPPRRPEPWSGVRPCLGYGQVAPQVPTAFGGLYAQLIQFDLLAGQGGMGEDCLNLNLWTPGLADGAARPVMVSFHGGGFAIGSSNASVYDGAQLASRHDVVVVGVNHRLASFGFLDLAGVGAPDDFPSAGVAGLLDLVAALEWVRDNIAAFGGDPDRVMIFGQSGGGWKTSALLAAPAAKGLFHRAAVQSGSWLRAQTREEASAVAVRFVAELGLTKDTIAAIRDLPWEALLAAQAKLGAQAFAPVLDGHVLPRHPFEPNAPEASADVPLIVSTTLDDAGLFFDDFGLDEAGLAAQLGALYGAAAEPMLALYRGLWPETSPFLLRARIITDAGFRRFAHIQAGRKADQGRAPVWACRWDWPSPAFDGRFGAVHAIDVAASFGNAREAILGGGVQPGRGLGEALSAAWAAFARTGDPNCDAIPRWPACDLDRRQTLVFDDPIRLEADPHAELRTFWEAMPPAAGVLG